ncbi:MAG: hypothetical protein WCT19_04185 [Candidatus Paceibacterota bacterium]|jgi:hypothetical protein
MEKSELKKIKNVLENFFSGKKLLFFSGDPYKDWKKVVAFFIILNLLTLGVCVYLFNGINQGDFFKVSKKSEVRIGAIKREALNTALEFFTTRNAMFEGLKKTDVMADPLL